MHTVDKTIKCLVWDLDNTLWDGILLEDKDIRLKGNVVSIIKTLDERGILQSVASKNDHDLAADKLTEFGLLEYFLYIQINWNSKAESIRQIARSLNIGTDTIAFIDDQPGELDEVRFSLPEVYCIDASDLINLTEMKRMKPAFITEDSKMRRKMYLADISRNRVIEELKMPREDFLATLNMILSIFPAGENDLERAEELTVRTHQLNATGYTFSREELDEFRRSAGYKLLMARLEDKYGQYGNIGMVLIECAGNLWTIKLLLVSCRVISYGIGTILLNHVMAQARLAAVRLRAEFIPNDRNRMMNVTFRMAGFYDVERRGPLFILENDLTTVTPVPDYIGLRTVQ